LRFDFHRHAELGKRSSGAFCHALWDVSGQVCGDRSAYDALQWAGSYRLDRCQLPTVASGFGPSNFAHDLSTANRIPPPSRQFGVDAVAYAPQQRKIGGRKIIKGRRPFHMGSTAQDQS
jgi:hypothetical protein